MTTFGSSFLIEPAFTAAADTANSATMQNNFASFMRKHLRGARAASAAGRLEHIQYQISLLMSTVSYLFSWSRPVDLSSSVQLCATYFTNAEEAGLKKQVGPELPNPPCAGSILGAELNGRAFLHYRNLLHVVHDPFRSSDPTTRPCHTLSRLLPTR